ncbi:MAG: response regulator transcription factor [Geitlerinemataceae cyanobacterium]
MKTIFVVEDGNTEQAMIKALLTQAGYEVMLSSSVDEAWAKLSAASALPNLIVLDIVMPGKSGLELCRMIQEDPKFQQVPIVFCSSKSEEFDQFWALRQGAKDYVVKPYAPQQLLDTVEKHVT